MRLLSLVLALGLVAPPKSRARAREHAHPPSRGRPPLKQGRRSLARRRAAAFAPLASPCGRHVVEVLEGAVIVDGRRVHPAEGAVEVLGPPVWRGDGGALAWMERGDGETRLIVLPDLAAASAPIAWSLPANLARERLHWVGARRVVVGPEPLSPRAVASWSDAQE